MIDKEKGSAPETVEDLLWRFAEAEFDERSWVLRLKGVDVELEPRPLEILAYLLRHAGEVVTKEELLDEIWGRSSETISDKVLTNAVGKLRRALGDETEAIIATVHRRGYRLLAPVSRVVVGRRQLPQLDLKPGDSVPHRAQWRLLSAMDVSARSEVWLAEHAKTHERRVFKFSPDGARLSSLKREATLSRVLRESLGARPEFVRVLEWNFEEAPYFIECEYGGDDWLQWAEKRGGLAQIPLDQRLALFVQIAEAIGAAHGVGVLHKDIKPANLLVTDIDDGKPQVRVTDFGSGHLLDPGRLEQLGITRLGFTQTQSISDGALTGTPLYLAPELLAGHAPTQASDVYALGVLLYQLVVADFRRPLSAGWERDVDEELLREDIALAAAGDPGLRLDSARALAQRVARLPQRRLERAAAIRQQAVAAAAEASLARTRARQPLLIGLVAVLIGGIAISLYFQQTAMTAQREALRSAEVAEAINQFLTQDLVTLADPLVSGRKDLPLADALTAANTLIEPRFKGQPRVELALRESLGGALIELARWDQALEQLDKAQALGEALDDIEPVHRIRHDLQYASAATRASKMDAAKLHLDEADRQMAGLPGIDDELAILRELAWGNYHYFNARYKDAIVHYETARARFADADDALTEVHRLKLYQSLSTAYAQTGEGAKALSLFAELEQRLGSSLPADHPLVLYARFAQSTAALMSGDVGGAVSQLEVIVPAMETALGSQHENTLHASHRLGQAYFMQQKWPAALARSRITFEAFKAYYGPHSIPTLDAMNTYAESLKRQQQVGVAITLLREAVTEAETRFGAAHPLSLVVKANLADAYLDVNNAAPAQQLLKALEPHEATLKAITGDWPGQRAFHQGRIHKLGGRTKVACAEFRKASEVLNAQHPPEHWLRQRTTQALDDCPRRESVSQQDGPSQAAEVRVSAAG